MSWKCPECGSRNLTVTITAEARLIQAENGSEWSTELVGDHEFEGTSLMTCVDCHHCEAAASFDFDPSQRPTAPSLGQDSMFALEDAGLAYGFYFDNTGMLRTVQESGHSVEILTPSRLSGGMRWLQVTEANAEGAVQANYVTEFYPSARSLLPVLTRDNLSADALPGSLVLEDALRLALVLNEQSDDVCGWRDAVYRDALSMCADASTEILDWTAKTIGTQLIIELGVVAHVPTLINLFGVTWVTSGRYHYDTDNPAGVTDVRELPSFKRAMKRATNKGYETNYTLRSL